MKLDRNRLAEAAWVAVDIATGVVFSTTIIVLILLGIYGK